MRAWSSLRKTYVGVIWDPSDWATRLCIRSFDHNSYASTDKGGGMSYAAVCEKARGAPRTQYVAADFGKADFA